MSTFRDRYMERGIPLYEPSQGAPYPKGQCPKQGWYVIEVSGESKMPQPDSQLPADQRPVVIELLDEEAIQTLCENFDLTVNGGKGVFINDDHLPVLQGGKTRSKGWVQALDYYIDDTGRVLMAGYLDLTPDGLTDVNEDYYWAWSTEYKLGEYIRREDGKYSPTVLRGLAMTNTPDHEDQPGVSHCAERADYVTHSTPINHMNKSKTHHGRVLHSASGDNPDEKKEAVAVNTEENKDTETSTHTEATDDKVNHTDDDGWLGIANDIAEALELNSDATGDDIVAAVKALKADAQNLKTQVEDVATHSKSRNQPRVLHSRDRVQRDVTPEKGVEYRTTTGDDIRVPQRDMDLVTHCRKAVDEQSKILGRPLTEGEYNRTWNSATQSYGR